MARLYLTSMQVKVAAVSVAGEQLRRARERAGLTQQQLADEVGTTRQTVGAWEKRAYVRDTRSLGKVFDVLGLDVDGNPKDTASVTDADLRGMSAPALVALQGRITAEFAHRLAELPAYLQDPRIPAEATVNPETPPPFDRNRTDRSRESEQRDA